MVIVYCFVFIDVALGDHSKVGVANGGAFTCCCKLRLPQRVFFWVVHFWCLTNARHFLGVDVRCNWYLFDII
jgi:hypothetical protein